MVAYDAGWDIKGKHVHHRNGDTRDNRLENLEVLSPDAHKRRHAGLPDEAPVSSPPARRSANTRCSWWTRWPDLDSGPLWVGMHLNERAGETVLVGLEVWTEEPGHARAALGPAGDAVNDLLPFPATALRARDLTDLGLERLQRAFLVALSQANASEVVSHAAAALRPQRAGRPTLYPPEHFARVAGVYQRAVAQGSRRPTADVARAWSVSRSAAAKWISRARTAGHLPPSGR